VGQRLRETIIATLLVAIGITIALALAEAALRALGFSFPSFYMPDDVVGHRLKPGAEGWNRGEGRAYVKVNSQGLRDREHAKQKPPAIYRVAVLGDSYTEASHVELEETYWAFLPRHLTRCGFAPGKQVEAINFGVNGYGTVQELLTLRHWAWDYAPDLVLLAFFPGNDVRNNSKALEQERLRPFFVLRDGTLALDDSFRQSEQFREHKRRNTRFAALKELRLYQLQHKLRAVKLGVRHNAPIAAALAEGREDIPSLSEPGLDEHVLREPTQPAWQEAWTITETLLVAMHEEVRRRGARFVVAVLSAPAAVYPDSVLRNRYSELLGIDDLFYPEARVERLGRRHGFEVIPLGRDMQRHADRTGQFLHGFPKDKLGFGHWNQAGHALGASLIARQLCAPAEANRETAPVRN
jgi:hypothetical protein